MVEVQKSQKRRKISKPVFFSNAEIVTLFDFSSQKKVKVQLHLQIHFT